VDLSANNRLPYIDLLRAAAILYIVAVHHLDDYAGNIYYIKYNLITYLVLGLFMFISGCLLAQNNPINNRGDLRGFFYRRFLRIYPLYVLALFLFMLCSLVSFKDVLLNISLLNVVFDKSVLTLWFVSILCVFYIIYPLVVYRYSAMKTAMIAVSLCGLFVLLKDRFGLLDERLLRYFPLFLLGIVFEKHRLIERYIYNRAFVGGSALVLIASISLYIEAPRFNQVFLILLMVSAIPLLMAIGKSASTIVNKKLYVNIAYASFCMYLLHRVIFHLATSIYSSGSNIHMVVYLTLLAVPVIYITSFYLQKYYDRIRTKRVDRYMGDCDPKHPASRYTLYL